MWCLTSKHRKRIVFRASLSTLEDRLNMPKAPTVAREPRDTPEPPRKGLLLRDKEPGWRAASSGESLR